MHSWTLPFKSFKKSKRRFTGVRWRVCQWAAPGWHRGWQTAVSTLLGNWQPPPLTFKADLTRPRRSIVTAHSLTHSRVTHLLLGQQVNKTSLRPVHTFYLELQLLEGSFSDPLTFLPHSVDGPWKSFELGSKLVYQETGLCFWQRSVRKGEVLIRHLSYLHGNSQLIWMALCEQSATPKK